MKKAYWTVLKRNSGFQICFKNQADVFEVFMAICKILPHEREKHVRTIISNKCEVIFLPFVFIDSWKEYIAPYTFSENTVSEGYFMLTSDGNLIKNADKM